MHWVDSGCEGHVKAFFGGREAFAKIPRSWDKFNLYCEGHDESGKPFDNEASKDLAWAKKNHMALDHGYEESKPVGSLTIEDMRQAAAFRGGECLSDSMEKGDLWTKLKWRCAEGHEFLMSPLRVALRGLLVPRL
jgi:hypothetical protein